MPHQAQTPCHILIGSTPTTLDQAIGLLQKQFCSHRQKDDATACRCHICNGISEQQSAFVTWLSPSKEYVLKDLDSLFYTIRFALDPGVEHVFVLQDAQLLSTTCANRLLKVLEEPPPGYSFMLLTTDYHALLPTIQSRSTVVFEAAQDSPSKAGLMAFFIDPKKLGDPAGFDQVLRKTVPSHAHARLLVQELAIIIDHKKFAQPAEVKALLETAQRNAPQPGGAQHFLRWLYLNLHALQQGHV